MQLGELVHIFLSMVNPDRCPFCTAPEDNGTYTTHEGATNNSTTLRTIMNDTTQLVPEQSGARPKDGQGGRQPPDEDDPSPNPIFRDNTTTFPFLRGGPIGDFGDEAHHAISGNECMRGEPIEGIIKNPGHADFEKDTGYSINNAANGVYLPSWNRSSGRWGKNARDGTWGGLSDAQKFQIMTLAMRAGAGQAHIGSHEGKTTPKHPESYPRYVKGELDQIRRRVQLRQTDCPFCREDGEPKRPAPPPYGVNQWLDALSVRIREHVTGPPRSWKYFVSQYAADYHHDVCRHGTLAQVLPDTWPPLG